MLQVTESWKQTHGGAGLGLMVVDKLGNPEQSEALESRKRELESQLRARFSDPGELADDERIKVYTDYYKRYKKTYHVLQQLESVIFRNKSIPRGAGLVEAMFMAELKNRLLTAGHDYDALKTPLTLDAAAGDEQYVLISGKDQLVKPGDMALADAGGIVSSIIHGPDSRTRIVSATQKAAFVVYAPEGISRQPVFDHLSDIYSYIRLFAPNAEIVLQQVYP